MTQAGVFIPEEIRALSFKLCEHGLDEKQSRFQIQRPEPCVRCFFLLLHT